MRVKDICILQNGRAFKPDDWSPNGIPIVRIQNLNDENAPFNYFQGEYDSVHEVNDGELLFSWSGTPGTSFGAFRWNRGKGVLNQHIFKVIPKIDVDKEYLRYAFNGNLNAIISKAHGGVGLQHITKKELDEIEIPIVSLADQHEIVSILHSVEKIFANRQFELTKLDDLIKARFVEMFGDPATNEKGWPCKSMSELTTKIGSGATPKGGKESYREEGIALIRSMNVHNGEFDYKDLAHISDEQAAKLDGVTIEPNDVLLNITGASVARSCVVPNEILPARVNQHVCIIRCKEHVIPEFLNKLLIDDNYQSLLWSIAGSGATREAITKQQVEKLQIILPPITTQKEFVEFVKQVDKSKSVVQKSLDETQLLLESLMQKYFN